MKETELQALHKEHQAAIELLKDIDANMRRAWSDRSLSHDAWPSALAQRLAGLLDRHNTEFSGPR